MKRFMYEFYEKNALKENLNEGLNPSESTK